MFASVRKREGTKWSKEEEAAAGLGRRWDSGGGGLVVVGTDQLGWRKRN
jgi:hypothetical protein